MRIQIILILILAVCSERLTADIYIESLCPYCMNFINGSLIKALKTPDIEKMVHIRLIPYGNTKRVSDSKGKWTFTCQHGAAECYGDVIELCAQNRVAAAFAPQDELPQAGIIHCVESKLVKPYTNSQFDEAIRQCSAKYLYDAADVIKCANSEEGVLLHLIAAQETDDLVPRHLGVPWAVGNRHYTDEDGDDIIDDLLKWACDNYTGDKIAACQTLIQ